MDIITNTVNNENTNSTNINQINPEYLGSVLINGEYHDKKTAKFLFLKGVQNEVSNKNEDVTESFYAKFLNLFKSK
jgi:hypothetical protein